MFEYYKLATCLNVSDFSSSDFSNINFSMSASVEPSGPNPHMKGLAPKSDNLLISSEE